MKMYIYETCPTQTLDITPLPALQCTTIGPPPSECKAVPLVPDWQAIIPELGSPLHPAPLVFIAP